MNEVEVINALTDKLSIPANALLGYYSKGVIVEGCLWLIVGIGLAIFLYVMGVIAKRTPDGKTVPPDELSNNSFGTGLQVAALIVFIIFMATNAPKLIVPEKHAIDEIMTAIGRASK